MLWPKFTWNTYSKSCMIFHLTSWSLTLDDLQRSHRGNWVFNGLYRLPGNYGSDFEQYLNRLDLISLLVNFSHELAHIMTTYDFLWAKEVILSNFRTDCNLTQFTFGQLFAWIVTYKTTYDFLWAKEVILSNIRTDFNFTQFHCWSTFDMNWHI